MYVLVWPPFVRQSFFSLQAILEERPPEKPVVQVLVSFVCVCCIMVS